MKFFNLGLLISLFIALPFNAFADDPHYGDRYKAPQVINNYTGCDPVANAGNEIHFDSSTYALQLGAGFATCENREGGKISFGQRLCENCPLINGSIGKEDGKDAYYGIGVSVKIK